MYLKHSRTNNEGQFIIQKQLFLLYVSIFNANISSSYKICCIHKILISHATYYVRQTFVVSISILTNFGMQIESV